VPRPQVCQRQRRPAHIAGPNQAGELEFRRMFESTRALLAPNDRVWLAVLTAAGLNGKLGAMVAYHWDTQRYKIEVDGAPGTKAIKQMLYRRRLLMLPPPPHDAAAAASGCGVPEGAHSGAVPHREPSLVLHFHAVHQKRGVSDCLKSLWVNSLYSLACAVPRSMQGRGGIRGPPRSLPSVFMHGWSLATCTVRGSNHPPHVHRQKAPGLTGGEGQIVVILLYFWTLNFFLSGVDFLCTNSNK
jgi:hypothetical protein